MKIDSLKLQMVFNTYLGSWPRPGGSLSTPGARQDLATDAQDSAAAAPLTGSKEEGIRPGQLLKPP